MRNVFLGLALTLFLLPMAVYAESEPKVSEPTHGSEANGEASPVSTPLVAPTPDRPKHHTGHTKRVKAHRIVMPIPEVQAALRAYIAKTEGDNKGLKLIGVPNMGACAATEVCEYTWYLQKFVGPHGEIGGEAIITSTIKRPSIYSVVTLAAGAANSVEGFAAFEVPASAAQALLRPAEKVAPLKSKTKKHSKLKRKMHGLGMTHHPVI